MEKKVCNLCGEELDELSEVHDFTIAARPGYGSKYDMTEIELRLCDKCFDKLVDSCAVSPVKKDWYPWGDRDINK